MRTFDREELGEAIATLRGRRSQTDAARRGGISRASWSLYEQGRRLPREGSLEKVLGGLGCTREQLELAVRKIHKRRLLDEAVELGEWPPGLVPAPGGAGRIASTRTSREAALPRELRAILDRHLASLEDAFVFLLRRGA